MEGKAICPPFEILAFYTAFDFSWDAQFDFSGECHEMWEIVFLTDGAVECVEDGKARFSASLLASTGEPPCPR